MNDETLKLKKASQLAITVVFGTILCCLWLNSLSLSMFLLPSALLGGVLLVKRNKLITNLSIKRPIIISDTIIITSLSFIVFVAPITLGIKQLIVIATLAIYIWIHTKLIFKGKLIQDN